MKVQGFQEGSSLFDVTPVENIFISEYMTMAPGDYVKVYLFVLNMCYFPRDNMDEVDIAKELGMDEDEVKKALVYWAQLSLIEIVSRRPFSIKMKNIKHMLQNDAPKKHITTNNQDLIMQIQQSFGGRRLLNTSDTKKVLGWSTNLKWSPEMIALVVAWCIEKKGRWVHFSYIDTVINSMSDQGVSTYMEAEKYLLTSNAKSSGATSLLNAWNENRIATVDEIRMYEKWVHTWEISEEAITKARENMVGVSGNKFKYLDSILFSWHQKGMKSADDVNKYYERADIIKNFAKAIYGKAFINEKLEEYYAQIETLGYSNDTIVKVAKILYKHGIRDIENFYDVIAKWNSSGDKTDNDIIQRAQYLDGILIDTKHMVEQWGIQRQPKQHEVKAYTSWIEKGYSKDGILDAAKKSIDAQGKISYMNAILENKGEKSANNYSKNNINSGVMSHNYTEDDYAKIWEAMEEV